ncbi:MAG TPA: hypothetical protein DD738_14285 [Ruminiclostridium sp.]|nr:hypothetical protein [Ruminiclostridium sp.]
MDEKNITSKLRAIVNIAAKRFIGLNKGSKILLSIGAVVFFIFLVIALALNVLFMADILRFSGQVKMIEWLVLYSFKFWIVLFSGAIIMDIFKNR